MRLDAAAIEGLRTMILASGTGQLAVGDLRAGDLADLAWSGNPAPLRSVAAALQRAAQGRRRHRRPAGVRNHAHDPAQAPVTPWR